LELLVQRVAPLGWATLTQPFTLGLRGASFWLAVTIAALSGSLFGITYRYAVRQDSNPQINLGVIFAFSLVRGLALVDVAVALSLRGWPWLMAVGESGLMFALAAGGIELGFHWNWIKPVRS
jgi:hypothetical protein